MTNLGDKKVSADAVGKQIDIIFKECVKDEKPFTLTKLANSLGICDDTLCTYGKHPDYSGHIKRAKNLAKQSLMDGGLTNSFNPTMSIFLLKVNHGMQDKIIIEQDAKVKIEPITFEEI